MTHREDIMKKFISVCLCICIFAAQLSGCSDMSFPGSSGPTDAEKLEKIRTSGEYRLSNFLLWQASYAEFYFTDTLWPDFDKAAFGKAMQEYAARDRRYGLVKQDEQEEQEEQDKQK